MTNERKDRIDEIIEDIKYFISLIRPAYASAALRITRVDQEDEFFHPSAILVRNIDTKDSMTILLNEDTDTPEVKVGIDTEEILDGQDFWRCFYVVNRNSSLKENRDD